MLLAVVDEQRELGRDGCRAVRTPPRDQFVADESDQA